MAQKCKYFLSYGHIYEQYIKEGLEENKKAIKLIDNECLTSVKLINVDEIKEMSENWEFSDEIKLIALAPDILDPDTHINKWFTSSIKNIMLEFDFLKKFASYRSMSTFYGLRSSYLYDKRLKRFAKTVIANNYLSQMIKNLSDNLADLIKEGNLEAIKAKNALMSVIYTYHYIYNPKPTANTQIDENLNQQYFSQITTVKQAYYLGLLFADGWISIQHSAKSSAYRVGIAFKAEDKKMLDKFAISLGFSNNKVYIRSCVDKKTGKKYKMAYLYFGAGSTSMTNSLAKDLIELGMEYEIDSAGNRYKIPILPVFCNKNGLLRRDLMLGFLLGYYDGDGTLKSGKYPIIYSSSKEFLLAISYVFKLGKVYETTREEFKSSLEQIHSRSLFSLSLSQKLFKGMMELNVDSLERKAVDIDKILIDKPIMTKRRIWLSNILSKETLEKILKTHSPSTIANYIGLDHNTFIKFIDRVYKIPHFNKAYYIGLSYERKKQSKNSSLNKLYEETNRFLIELRKNNTF